METFTALAVLLLGVFRLADTLHLFPKTVDCWYVRESGDVYNNHGSLTIYEDQYGEIEITTHEGPLSFPINRHNIAVADIQKDVCIYFQRPGFTHGRRCLGLSRAPEGIPDYVINGCGDRQILMLTDSDCPIINDRV